MITWGIISGADRLRHRPDELSRHPFSARRRGGRLLSRHDPLPHLLVPGGISRPRHLDAVHRRSRSPMRWRRSCRARFSAWTASSASKAGNGCSSSRRCRRSVLAFVVWFGHDRPAGRRRLARRRRSGTGWRRGSMRSARTIDRHHGVLSLFEGLRRSAGAGTLGDLFLRRDGELRDRLLHAADRQRHGPVEPDDRLRVVGALHHRHHRPDRLGLLVRSPPGAALAPDHRLDCSRRPGSSSPAGSALRSGR